METSNFGLDIPAMVSPLNAVIHPVRANSLILFVVLTAIIKIFLNENPKNCIG
jgi:hypothetical protein